MDFKFTGMDGDGDKLSSPCSSLERARACTLFLLYLGVLSNTLADSYSL